jgi:integrase
VRRPIASSNLAGVGFPDGDSSLEIVKVIAACDEIGRCRYERRRARAMVLLMRYAGLRISDVFTLEKNHVKGVYLAKRTIKNHRLIQVELPRAVLEALDVLPPPKAAAKDNLRLFTATRPVYGAL